MHGFGGFGCCGGWGGMGGFGLFGGILGLLFSLALIAAVVVAAVWLVRRTSTGSRSQSQAVPYDRGVTAEASPREILKQRYARGEITRDQYQEMLRDLS